MPSTASVDGSTLSTPSTLTRIRSPWSDPACIHKCSSAMKFLNWPSSWLPSQLFGVKPLILYGLPVSAEPAESQSAIDCREQFFTDSLQRVCNLLSDLLLQRNVIKTAVVAILACCYVVRPLLLPRNSRASNRLHLRWRLSALRYNVKWNSVLGRALSQCECVGRVIKCARQFCDKGIKGAGV